jgi:iron complex outermembrane receptor protein
LYGAGSGGAVLLKTNSTNQPSGVGVEYTGGSFGLHTFNVAARINEGANQQTISFNRLQSNGYRDWTKVERSVFSWDSRFTISLKQSIRSFLMYGDLSYQTPGGLTPAQYAANPRQARPAAGVFPGSAQANASVNQQTIFGGISHDFLITPQLKQTTTLYGAVSTFANPTIRNFERRSEPNAGGRAFFTYEPAVQKGKLKIITGAELQNGWYNIRVYRNRTGQSDSLQTEDNINPTTWNVFAQADWQLSKGWSVTAGASINRNKIEITRLNQFPLRTQSRTYENELAPRIAILKKLGNHISVYTSVAKGFSPPTSAEVVPSTGVITTSLNAEEGWNYEAGIRWNWNEQLFIDANAFYFRLTNTIVQRRDGSGADFFENAGSTEQKGLESAITYYLRKQAGTFLKESKLWLNVTLNDFQYLDFKQLATDFSGKKLPSVPNTIIAAGWDVQIQPGINFHLTYLYNSKTPLNDANTFYADAFQVFSLKLSSQKINIGRLHTTVFAGIENLLDETYSLGNDINAAANRFFNVAPGRNYFAGLSVYLPGKKKM